MFWLGLIIGFIVGAICVIVWAQSKSAHIANVRIDRQKQWGGQEWD